MTTRRSLLVLVASGCGSAPPAASPPPPAPAPARTVPRPSPRIEPTSCKDAAIILRGPRKDDASAAAREQAIEAACVDDGWSRAVLDCIGDKPAKHETCLDQLAPEHRKRYDATRVSRHLDCEGNIGRVEAYEPSLDTFAGDDRALLVQLRRQAIEERCVADAWDQPTLQCLAGGRDPAVCRALLSQAQDAALVAALASLQTLGTKLVAAQQRPAALACKAIAAAHYSDRAWTKQAPTLVGAARKRAIAELRTWLARSCKDEQWNLAVRACASVGPIATCMRGMGNEARWDFTPLATPFGVGPCDHLARQVSASLRCDQVPQVRTREAIDSLRERLRAGIPPDELGGLCDDVHTELADVMATAGCKP